MRIHCPFCGERDLSEFVYLGDAQRVGARSRELTPDRSSSKRCTCATIPPGVHDELWYHAVGCRSWLQASRATRARMRFLPLSSDVRGRAERYEHARSAQRLRSRRTDRSAAAA